jgi:hypothetical protein
MHRNARYRTLLHTLDLTDQRRRALFMLGYRKFIPRAQDQLDLNLFGEIQTPRRGE